LEGAAKYKRPRRWSGKKGFRRQRSHNQGKISEGGHLRENGPVDEEGLKRIARKLTFEGRNRYAKKKARKPSKD